MVTVPIYSLTNPGGLFIPDSTLREVERMTTDTPVVYNFTHDTTTFLTGMLDLRPWEYYDDDPGDPTNQWSPGTVLSGDDVWVGYMESGLAHTFRIVNAYDPLDDVTGDEWFLNYLFMLNFGGSDRPDNRDSNRPMSVQWAWLAHRTPARAVPASIVPLPSHLKILSLNMNVRGNIADHSDMRERPLQVVWDFYDTLRDADAILGEDQDSDNEME